MPATHNLIWISRDYSGVSIQGTMDFRTISQNLSRKQLIHGVKNGYKLITESEIFNHKDAPEEALEFMKTYLTDENFLNLSPTKQLQEYHYDCFTIIMKMYPELIMEDFPEFWHAYEEKQL